MKVILAVQGMTCAACVNTIENFVKKQEGVEKVSVGLLAEKAEVYYRSSKITPEQIRASFEDIGYNAQILADV
jgi:Cu+-exporting ATPase